MNFYRSTLEQLLREGEISTSDKVVVFCGGNNDAAVLCNLQFSDVKITNVDARNEGNIRGLPWEFQDVENPTYSDGQFDVAIVHAGLHHCHSPHRALLQMYRVASKAVIVFESRDSLAMRIAKVARLTPDFELEAVRDEGYGTGGVANGPIPNFIYRWTEREVEKAIRSYDPAYVERIRYFYGLEVPVARFGHSNSFVRRAILRILSPIVWILVRLFRRQGNQFGFAIMKTGQLRNWLVSDNGKIRLLR